MVARTDQGHGAGGTSARDVRSPDRGFADLGFLRNGGASHGTNGRF